MWSFFKTVHWFNSNILSLINQERFWAARALSVDSLNQVNYGKNWRQSNILSLYKILCEINLGNLDMSESLMRQNINFIKEVLLR